MAVQTTSDPQAVGPDPDPRGAGADSIRIETTPTGPTVSVRTSDGRWVRLHSGRDPVAEADRDVARLFADGAPPAVVCIGVGLGYLLEALERRAPATRVLAIEPSPAVARAMAARRSWGDWLTSRRLTLLVGPDYAGAAEAWRCLDGEVTAPVIVAPVVEREFPREVARARTIARDASFGARANAEARRKFAPRYLLNTIRNIPLIARSANVTALFDAFAGVPAVVIGAGPSLDENMEALRAVGGRALLIAVDTAARPLLAAGVTPHLVVALDPSETNARHLRNLPDPSNTWLVAEGSLDPSAFGQFEGRTFTFAVADHHPWPWLRSLGLERGRLRAWGSVLTSAFDLALCAGCNPIVFAGADLAYSGGRPYCRGTTFEHEWARRAAGGETLDAIWRSILAAKEQLQRDDMNGVVVPTAPQLLAFRDWLVEQTRRHGTRRFVNASGGGVLAGGRLEQQSLSEVLGALDEPELDARAAVRDGWLRGRSIGSGEQPRSGVRAAVAAMLTCAPQNEPVRNWLAFAGPDLTVASIDDALRRATTDEHGRSSASTVGHMPLSAFRRDAPERLAMLWSVLAGQAVDDSASPAGRPVDATPQSLTHALERASRALAALLQCSGLLDPEALDTAPLHPRGTPASRGLPWSPAAVGVTLEFEAALADVLTYEGSAGHPDASAAIERLGARLVRIEAPEPEAETTADPQETADLTGHLALLADWVTVLGRLGGARTWNPPLRVSTAFLQSSAHALRRGTSAVAQIGQGPLEVTIAGRRHALVGDCVPSSDVLMEALTGALVRVPPGPGTTHVSAPLASALSLMLPTGSTGDIGVSVSFFSAPRDGRSAEVQGPRWLHASRATSPVGWVEPLRVNDAGQPCMIGAVLDESHALFTRVNGTYSLRVDASGQCVEDAPWPEAIAGQVPWGPDGAIAWRNGDTSRVMWRERPDSEVHIEEIPCARVVAHPQQDGAIWWTSSLGGVWSWTPGGTWRLLVETPPVLGLAVDAGTVRLDSRGRSLDFAVRDEVTHWYAWTPGSLFVTPVPLGPEGPCWSASEKDDWTAQAYPYADTVVLRHRDGGLRTLACSYPFNVAWAGPSLVVSTGRGELLVFRHLLTWLTSDLSHESHVAV